MQTCNPNFCSLKDGQTKKKHRCNCRSDKKNNKNGGLFSRHLEKLHLHDVEDPPLALISFAKRTFTGLIIEAQTWFILRNKLDHGGIADGFIAFEVSLPNSMPMLLPVFNVLVFIFLCSGNNNGAKKTKVEERCQSDVMSAMFVHLTLLDLLVDYFSHPGLSLCRIKTVQEKFDSECVLSFIKNT